MNNPINVLLVDSQHLFKDEDGYYYAQKIFNDFGRYLQAFDRMKVACKVRHISKNDAERLLKIDTSKIEICEIPWYQGLKQMSFKLPSLIRAYKNMVKDCDCYILRVLQIESIFVYFFRNKKKPYAVEVVNDPSEWKFFPTFLRIALAWLLRRMVKNANGVSYVTKDVLQNKYPAKARLIPDADSAGYFETHYSTVEIKKADLREPKTYPDRLGKIRIVHIANVIVDNSKGHKNLIAVAGTLIQKGYDVEVDFIGSGLRISDFEKMACDMKIDKKVRFIGRIDSREKLLDALHQYDLMVFPTYSEGLPRCIIEAYAVGLPCLSSPVGGVPELVASDYLFEPDDISGYVNMIVALMEDGKKLEKMSIDGIEAAKEYLSEKLEQRRALFYTKLRDIAKRNQKERENNESLSGIN